MRRLAPILLSLLLVASCHAANIPTPEMRQPNYSGGSCAHASMVTLLRMHDRPQGAEWWRAHYRGAQSHQALAAKAKAAGLAVRSTFSGDAAFLETVDGAVIDWLGKRGGRHAVVFCGYRGGVAIISDPNETKLRCYPKEAFVRYWQRCGGRAVALTRGT